MTASKKERERLKEAMRKSLIASPKHQRELAEFFESRLGAEERKSEQSNGKKKGKK